MSDFSDYGTGYNGEECPFCWGTGTVTVMETGREGEGVPRPRPCPEGCPVPGEVPF